MVVTKEQKIKSILEATTESFFSDENKGIDKGSLEWAEAWLEFWKEVTIEDVRDSVIRDGLLGVKSRFFFTRSGQEDGLYLIESAGKYLSYGQERGVQGKPLIFATKKEALEKAVEGLSLSFLI